MNRGSGLEEYRPVVVVDAARGVGVMATGKLNNNNNNNKLSVKWRAMFQKQTKTTSRYT